MSRLTTIKPRNLEKILLQLGFRPVRQKGSHVFYEHADRRTTTIPFHGNREISVPLLKTILREIGIGQEDFQKLL